MPTTVDLGKIKVVWRGAFVAGTSYTVDDAVSYDGSSYICTSDTSSSNDPTVNTASWDVMAAGSAPLTAQGNLLTHNGTTTVELSAADAAPGDAVVKQADGSVDFQAVPGTYKGMRPRKPEGFYYDDGQWGRWMHYGANFYERGWLHMPEHVSNGNIAGDAYAQGVTVPYRELSFPLLKPNACTIGPDFMTGYNHQGTLNYSHGVITEDHRVVISGDYTHSPIDYTANNTNCWSEAMFQAVPGDKMGRFPAGDYPVQMIKIQGSWFLLMKSGDVWSSGSNNYGQLGHNDTRNKTSWQKIKQIGSEYTVSGLSTHIVGICGTTNTNSSESSSYYPYVSVYFLDVHGRLFSCGYNGAGELGHGDTSNRSVPTLVSGVSNVDMVHCGGSYNEHFVYARTTAGELYTWGDNSDGQLGLGDTTDRNTPTLVSHGSPVKRIYAATYGYHNGTNDYRRHMGWMINDSGELYGSGENGNGYLGVGDSTDRNAFTRVGSDLFFSVSWSNTEYRYPRRAAIGRVTTAPTSGREIDFCNGQLFTWGYNNNGGLLTGDTSSKNSPFQVTETSSQLVMDTKGSTTPKYTFAPNDIQFVWFESTQSNGECQMFLLQDATDADGKRLMWLADQVTCGDDCGHNYDVDNIYRDSYQVGKPNSNGPILIPADWNDESDSIYKNKLEFWSAMTISGEMAHFYVTSDQFLYVCGGNGNGMLGIGGAPDIKRAPRRTFIASNS